MFPEQQFEGWTALAVSEDRSETDPLPGVTWTECDGVVAISGYKTWIAACRSISSMIVKAGKGQNVLLAVVPVETDGVDIDAYAQPKLLPKLSQGRAHFDAVPIPADNRLDAGRLRSFGKLEALCTYTAFAASVQAHLPSMSQTAAELLALAEQSAGDPHTTRPRYAGRVRQRDRSMFQAGCKRSGSVACIMARGTPTY